MHCFLGVVIIGVQTSGTDITQTSTGGVTSSSSELGDAEAMKAAVKMREVYALLCPIHVISCFSGSCRDLQHTKYFRYKPVQQTN